MSILRYGPSRVLLLFGALALVGSACDADETRQNGGEDAWSGVEAPADAALLVDQSEEGETMVSDASTELAAADVPSEATLPGGDAAEEPIGPGPVVLQTATFALG